MDLRYAGPSQDVASTEDSWQTCRVNAGAEGAGSVGKHFGSFTADVKKLSGKLDLFFTGFIS